MAKLKTAGVKMLDINGFKEKRDFYMVSLKGRAQSPLSEAFRKYVLSRCEDIFEG